MILLFGIFDALLVGENKVIPSDDSFWLILLGKCSFALSGNTFPEGKGFFLTRLIMPHLNYSISGIQKYHDILQSMMLSLQLQSAVNANIAFWPTQQKKQTNHI